MFKSFDESRIWIPSPAKTAPMKSLPVFPLDLEDAYNLVYASMNGASELKTFDQQLQKVYKKHPNDSGVFIA